MVAGLSDEANVSSLIKERAVMYYLVVMGAVAAFYAAVILPSQFIIRHIMALLIILLHLFLISFQFF